ncbi:aspartate/glutamate racemase family protein [Actinomycetospora endophytica]|uniref:Aspartate/glutamate racemase family protein n=1 Tax=Actinomycetospora endophytica TaxID=2291215 RepID=A0ABS8P208_9PSEU|nr:aspartate/glutamate racemase family protein [Actinomycetospora endophytica]MCD2192270.1 aspartate/glutamate racemase family protein [Actinomycetospora endophytica]
MPASGTRIALIDSGLGMLPTAGWLRHLRPDAHLDLLMDPAGMPWGGRPGEWIVERVLGAARLAVARGADVVVVPCNTASVTALVPLRAELEPARPVVGTVPAVKPAAASGEPFGIWATEGTSASAYQADLVALFATPGQATAVPCPGLADAVEAAEPGAVAAAVAFGASRTPGDVHGIVLGCTHYPLVSDAIAAALPNVRLYDSSRAVAGQALRRLGLDPAPDAEPAGVSVLLSGDEGDLPTTARSYPVGAALAGAGPVGCDLLPPPVRDDALADAGASVPRL